MAGAFFLALAKRSRTRLAPTPTNISTNSEPLMLKNGTSASPATARASIVLPVPGLPTSSTPFGILAPNSWYFLGCLRKSTTSSRSCLAFSLPAISLNTTFLRSGPYSLALLLPKPIAWLFCPWAERIINIKKPIISMVGISSMAMFQAVSPVCDGALSEITLVFASPERLASFSSVLTPP